MENLLFTKQHKNITKMVDGPISWNEGAHLAYLASLVPHGGTIVEIGSNVGRSACYMGHGLVDAHKTDVRIYCIDLWSLGGVTQQTNYHDPKGLRHQKFKDNIKAFGLSAIISDYEADSVKFAQFNWNKSIDLLFIDAGHSYEAVSADYRAWKDYVRVGGFIAFHDYMEMWPGIVKLLDNEVFPDPMWSNWQTVERLKTAVRSK